MKRVLFITAFLFFSVRVFAQYGKLEQLRAGDTTRYVMRTPKETLVKLNDTSDKEVKKKAGTIERVERQLEFARNGYINNRITPINLLSFTNSIKWLEDNGVGVQYYLEEYFTYFPRKTERIKQTGLYIP